MSWLRTRSRDAQRRPTAGRRIGLVSALDGRTHLATETAYSAALAAGAGRCPAVCGHTVAFCSLSTPPGPTCPLCTTAS